MNSDSEQSFRVPSLRRKQWLQVAGYVALLLLVLWLKSRLPEGAETAEPGAERPPVATQARPRQDAPPATAQRPLPRADHNDSATSEYRNQTPKTKRATNSADERDEGFVVRNVRVLNEDQRVIYRGDIDVGSTIARIDRGERLRFSHDGIVFENREKRLPAKPSGYYREFIHPTKGENGPGGQRIVVGRDGEAYYSPDHYRTFRRVR